MKTSTATKPRLGMVVKLYKNGKLVDSTTRRVKARILDFVQSKPDTAYDVGYIKVTYNAKKEYFNHAYFKTFKRFNRLLVEMTAWDLVSKFK